MEFDLLISGGRVVDGSGREPAYRADVGIVGERVAAVGDLASASAGRVLDATDRVVCPGFIDVHVHSEVSLLGGPHQYGGLLQGVTSQLLAPDGFGWAPLGRQAARELWESTLFAYGASDLEPGWPRAQAYLAEFTGRTPANVVPQVPHTAVRMAVLGWEPRPATADELKRMETLVREWMEAGAVALNLGLDYQPSAFADTAELVALSRVAREYGGIYAAHIRYNDLGTAGAWRETMQIAQQAQIPVHISHESVNDETEALLEEAADRCDLTFESYMYPAGCTHLALMLPNWAQAGGPAALRRRLHDPEVRARIGEALHRRLSEGVESGARAVIAASHTGRYIGMSLTEAAAAEGQPLKEFALRLLEDEQPYVLMIYHRGGGEPEHRSLVQRTARHPRMMVASDGIYHGPHAHPRGYGCFARVLRLCVRELGAIGLEEAVYKMSGFPAQRFGIRDRGLLRAGLAADVVVFDPNRVADRATWEQPRLTPVGIDWVLVNGRAVVAGGNPTNALPGRVLRPLA